MQLQFRRQEEFFFYTVTVLAPGEIVYFNSYSFGAREICFFIYSFVRARFCHVCALMS